MAESDTVASYFRVILQRKPHHIVVYAGGLCGLFEPFKVYVIVVNGDVACYGFGEDHSVLHHCPALPSPPFEVVAVDVFPGNAYGSGFSRVISQHKFDERGLAAARSADYRRHLSFGDCERHVFKSFFQCMGVVPEIYAVDVY